MLIYLLRHGEAAPAIPDAERPLTADGARKLRGAANTWATVVVPPARILASPFRRAQETARILAEAVHFDASIETSHHLQPNSDVTMVLNLLREASLDRLPSIALVGHQPLLGILLDMLLTGAGAGIPMATGMLVAVETGSPSSLLSHVRLILSQEDALELS